jgi:hypothetical protein
MLAPGTAENRPAPSQRSSNPNCTTEGAQKSADTLPLPPGKSKSGNGSYKTIDYPEIPKVRDHERACCLLLVIYRPTPKKERLAVEVEVNHHELIVDSG